MELFRGLKYATPIAILLWIAIFIAFKLIMQGGMGLDLEKEVREHGTRIEAVEKDVIKLNKDLSDGLNRVDQSNQYLREQNRDILKEVIKRNNNADQRDFEIKKIAKTNQFKMFGMIFGASGLAALALDIIMKLIKQEVQLMIKKVDWHSKVLWTSLTALVIVLVQQVAKVFGIEFSNDLANQVQGIVNTVLTILGLVGVVYDTTKGDSK